MVQSGDSWFYYEGLIKGIENQELVRFKSKLFLGLQYDPFRVVTGLVTAKHVAIQSMSNKVRLSCDCNARLREVTPCSVDGAFMDSDCGWISKAHPISPLVHVSPKMPVKFCDQNNNVIITEVLHMTDTVGLYSDSHSPIYVYLKHYGVAGDSGW